MLPQISWLYNSAEKLQNPRPYTATILLHSLKTGREEIMKRCNVAMGLFRIEQCKTFWALRVCLGPTLKITFWWGAQSHIANKHISLVSSFLTNREFLDFHQQSVVWKRRARGGRSFPRCDVKGAQPPPQLCNFFGK